jgi:Response regulators consisting of a CheY-like receiver domain and a winged-helix DNA-binding domain
MVRPYRVLIIDDDQSILTLIQLLFEHEGFTLLQADNGEEGVQIAAQERPDCILLDIAMPRRTGLQVYHDLQASDAAGIPIIIFSAIPNQQTEAEWLALPNVVDVIRKPFMIDQLVARIANICDRYSS